MGRAAALEFLAQGAKVVINDLNAKTAEETIELAKTRGHGHAVRFMRGDVSQERDIEALVALATRDFGRVDCMFNNAGLGGAMGPITETSVEDWDRTVAVLLRSVFLGIKHAGRAMQLRGEGGSIINTASVAGLGGGGGPAAYSASKPGVVSLTLNAVVEFAPTRIRVNTIAPGGIHTPLIPAADAQSMLAFMKGRQAWPDVGLAEDIAHAALFFASGESRFLHRRHLDGRWRFAGLGPRPISACRLESAGRLSSEQHRRGRDAETQVVIASPASWELRSASRLGYRSRDAVRRLASANLADGAGFAAEMCVARVRFAQSECQAGSTAATRRGAMAQEGCLLYGNVELIRHPSGRRMANALGAVVINPFQEVASIADAPDDHADRTERAPCSARLARSEIVLSV